MFKKFLLMGILTILNYGHTTPIADPKAHIVTPTLHNLKDAIKPLNPFKNASLSTIIVGCIAFGTAFTIPDYITPAFLTVAAVHTVNSLWSLKQFKRFNNTFAHFTSSQASETKDQMVIDAEKQAKKDLKVRTIQCFDNGTLSKQDATTILNLLFPVK